MIYLDNSATTNPKPQAVKNAVIRAMNYYSFNSGRGGYKESVNTSDMIFSCREKPEKGRRATPQGGLSGAGAPFIPP